MILASNKKILKEILAYNNMEYIIIEALDGLDIIKIVLAYEKNYHLVKCVITDENMDYFNGSDAIAFIRKFEKINKKPRTKIISLTSHENIMLVNHIKASGADKVLSKPLTFDLLRSSIFD